jgi:hypothetical protein
MTWCTLHSSTTHHWIITLITRHSLLVSRRNLSIRIQDTSNHISSHYTLWLNISSWLLRKLLLCHLLLLLHGIELLLHLLILLLLCKHVILLLKLLLVLTIIHLLI